MKRLLSSLITIAFLAAFINTADAEKRVFNDEWDWDTGARITHVNGSTETHESGSTETYESGSTVNRQSGSTTKVDDLTESTSGNGVTIDVKTRIRDGNIEYEGAPYDGARLFGPPRDSIKVFDDFFSAGYIPDAADTNIAGLTILKGGKFSETAGEAEYLVSVVDGNPDESESIIIMDNAYGGWLEMDNNDAIDDTVSVQRNGEMWYMASNDLTYEIVIEIEDVSDNNTFFGLATATTDLIDNLPNDYIGFRTLATTNIDFVSSLNGSVTTNAAVATIADATSTVGLNQVRLGFQVRASDSNVVIFVDGVSVATNAGSNVPTDEWLADGFAIEATNTVDDYIRIDYIFIQQNGRLY